MDTSTYDGSVTVPLCIYTGILYVAYNINAIPMGMFSLTRQTKRKETFISGLILRSSDGLFRGFVLLCDDVLLR